MLIWRKGGSVTKIYHHKNCGSMQRRFNGDGNVWVRVLKDQSKVLTTENTPFLGADRVVNIFKGLKAVQERLI